MTFKFSPTRVMTLGNLGSVTNRNVGDIFPMPPRDFFNPPMTTPQFPQNLMRQTLNGVHRFKGVAFGDLPTDVPVALQDQTNIPGPTLPSTATVLNARVPVSPMTVVTWGAVATASSLLSLYHGMKRNNSLGWGLWWGFMGAMFPLITPTVALAEGFAVRKGRK